MMWRPWPAPDRPVLAFSGALNDFLRAERQRIQGGGESELDRVALQQLARDQNFPLDEWMDLDVPAGQLMEQTLELHADLHQLQQARGQIGLPPAPWPAGRPGP